MTADHSRRLVLIAGALLLSACLIAYLIYAQGFRTGWTFDDGVSLAGLEAIHDRSSAWSYVIADKGISPLRRPLAMASFLLNQSDWPGHPQGFRNTNVLIHLLNGLLLALVSLRIGRLIPPLMPRATHFAVSLSIIWLLHPLLASSTLIAVQRMTLLAATFSLLGVLCYLHGRARLSTQPLSGYVWMGGGLALNTLLGTLAKENAALTPLLVAVLEYTLLTVYAPLPQRGFTLWRRLFFGVPALLLVAYAAFYLWGLNQHYIGRPFTPGERLWSESVILWDYVRQIVLPDITVMGPYQDDSARIRGPSLLTLAATAAWMIALAASLALRRRAPVLAFANLFFCVGHLLESTIFNLELYFEHRNYLPSLGPLGAFVGAIAASNTRWHRLALPLVALALTILLWRTTTLWGSNALSAQSWARMHPTSVRAAQALADVHDYQGQRGDAVRVIVDQYRINPYHGYLAMQAVLTQCFNVRPAGHTAVIAQVTHDAPVLTFHTRALLTLHSLITHHAQGHCPSLKPQQLVEISTGLLANPAYQRSEWRSSTLWAQAQALKLAGDQVQAVAVELRAYQSRPNIQMAQAIFFGLIKGGHEPDARRFLVEARQLQPGEGKRFDAWENALTRQGQ